MVVIVIDGFMALQRTGVRLDGWIGLGCGFRGRMRIARGGGREKLKLSTVESMNYLLPYHTSFP